MAKATRVHSAPRPTAPENPPVKIEKDESLAAAFREMESPINEIANMAGINSSLMEATAHNPIGRKGHTVVSDQEMEQILFSAYHLERMIVDLKKRYYAGYYYAGYDGGKAVT